MDVVTGHLQAAERRHDLASGLLTELAADPAAATAEERAAIAARLHQISEQAAATVNQIATDASRTIADQHDLAGREAGSKRPEGASPKRQSATQVMEPIATWRPRAGSG